MTKHTLLALAFLAIAGALGAWSGAAQAGNCTTTCYGSGAYRTCNTYCF